MEISTKCILHQQFAPTLHIQSLNTIKTLNMIFDNDNLILVYKGTESSANILQGHLESVEIKSVLNNENESARLAGFGSTGKCEVFILERESDKARPIVEEFIRLNS